MLGLGVGEVIIILVVALVVLGPTKLPQVARQVGKGLREFRRHASDLQHTFDEVAREAEREERERERAAALGVAKTDVPPVPAIPVIVPPDHPPYDMNNNDCCSGAHAAAAPNATNEPSEVVASADASVQADTTTPSDPAVSAETDKKS